MFWNYYYYYIQILSEMYYSWPRSNPKPSTNKRLRNTENKTFKLIIHPVQTNKWVNQQLHKFKDLFPHTFERIVTWNCQPAHKINETCTSQCSNQSCNRLFLKKNARMLTNTFGKNNNWTTFCQPQTVVDLSVWSLGNVNTCEKKWLPNKNWSVSDRFQQHVVSFIVKRNVE